MSLFDTAPGIRELITCERNNITEARGETISNHESYARVADAVERAEAAVAEYKKALKEAWNDCKDKDTAAFDAYMGTIESTAMQGAMAWLVVAAEAGRAQEG